MTPFFSKSRNCSRSCAASSMAPPRRAASRSASEEISEHAVSPQARSHHGGSGPRPGRRARRLVAGRRHGGAKLQGARHRRRRDRKSTRLNSSHTEIYTLSLHDALPISPWRKRPAPRAARASTCCWSPTWWRQAPRCSTSAQARSEEHTSELQSHRDLHSFPTRRSSDLTMAEAARAPGGARVDLLLVADMVAPSSKVLDIGAGDGELLRILGEQRGVDGRGIELSREGVNECVAKGLAVIQGDADTDLADYPDDAFDYVILSQTLQATRQPRVVLEHMLRIGRNAVVSFPNFGHWKIRLQLFFGGHMPSTDNLPYAWWDSPNIHFCTIKDFVVLCDVTGAKMERAVAFNAWGTPLRFNAPWWFWNLFGEQAVFLLSRRG